MTEEGSFAYGASAVATTDGKELLVYDPSDEAPRWRETLSADVAHVAVSGDRVIAVDADGRLSTYDAKDGEERSMIDVGAPNAIAASDSAIALALANEIVIVHGEEKRSVALAGARALAFDGAKIGAGTEDGDVVVIDEADARTTEAKVGAAVRGLCRHPRGFWLATAADKVYRVDDNGAVEIVTRASGKTPSAITCSGDGRMIGIVLDPKTVVVIAYPSRDTVLSVIYPERRARKIEFVEGGRFVWVGMDLGDANKIDLDNEDVYRTDPHEGRTRNTWLLSVAVERTARRGGDIPGPKTGSPDAAPAAPPAAKPVAQRQEEEVPASQTASIREARLPPSPPEKTRIVLGVLAVAVAVALITLRCG
jgi:hypothetical protein